MSFCLLVLVPTFSTHSQFFTHCVHCDDGISDTVPFCVTKRAIRRNHRLGPAETCFKSKMLGFAERGRGPVLLLTRVPVAPVAGDAPPAPPALLLPLVAAAPGSDRPACWAPGEDSTAVAGCCQVLRTAARHRPKQHRRSVTTQANDCENKRHWQQRRT